MQVQYKLCNAQAANGDNNSTDLRENGLPVIDADGWFDLTNHCRRFDIYLTSASVTTGFDVQLYTRLIDGTEFPYGDVVNVTTNGQQTPLFQEPVTANKIKLKMANRTDGTLTAEIHAV